MIVSLRGNIIQSSPFFLHLEVGGVGYGIKTPLNVGEYIALQKLREIFIYTRIVYREDSQTLYGFLHEQEALLFDFLCELSGIGPSIAMNIISTLGSPAVLRLLIDEDSSLLVRVPKVGKTKAEKILFEAKSKKKKLMQLNAVLGSELPKASVADTSKEVKVEAHELVEEALGSLGYAKKEIDLALAKAKNKNGVASLSELSVAEQIKELLKFL